ncbi:hypothetical protein EA795_19195 [Stutzerimonas nitrititolerans]|uniref:Uncharacterized protein n=1 Tax=Stutzerimonas nitrititolerans TaxID=2482751 RepID=A0ABX9UWB0_9GAMM|nr:hypothetical protein EA795_19195 [Stutzerimonas nitrititolerans]
MTTRAPDEICPYEQEILKSRWKFFLFAGMATATPALAMAACYFFQAPTSWVSRSGAVMALLAYLSERYAKSMESVLRPSGFVGNYYSDTHAKYFRFIGKCDKTAMCLVVVGALIWGFGDLIPLDS